MADTLHKQQEKERREGGPLGDTAVADRAAKAGREEVDGALKKDSHLGQSKAAMSTDRKSIDSALATVLGGLKNIQKVDLTGDLAGKPRDTTAAPPDGSPEKIVSHLTNDADRQQFKTALETFKRERLEKQSPPISEKEYKAVLKDVDALLAPDDKHKESARLNAADRTLVAKQILSLASHPSSADQGRFNTCEMATLEKVLWSREPSAVSGLLRQAALDGTIENDNDHSKFKLSKTPFTKDLEGPSNAPKPGERLFASQIFQTSLIEREWSKRDIGFGAGALEYTFTKPSLHHEPGDGGERFVMKFGPNKGKVLYDKDDHVPIVDPGMDFSRIGKIYDSVAKHKLNGEPIVLAATDGKSYLDANHRDSVAFVHDASELTQKLRHLQDHKQLPIIIAVVDRNGNDKDLHVITIRDFDRHKNVVTIDDQMGPKYKNIKITPAQLMTRGHSNTMRTEDLKPWQLPEKDRHVGLQFERRH